MKKSSNTKNLSVLTAYDFNTARALEEAEVDMILVGDSLAMVALGYENTTQVSMEEMLICTAAVARGVKHTTIIADLPYVAVSESDQNQVIHHCQRLIEAGAQIIKIENARKASIELILRLRSLNIRVMGHIGYTPQDLELFKDSKIIRDSKQLMQDAKALEKAGVESIVLEMIPSSIANEITEEITPITIGIGSGSSTNGQVLVSDDLLGRYNLINPKFLRRYANQYNEMLTAFKNYISDVRAAEYPSSNESYH